MDSGFYKARGSLHSYLSFEKPWSIFLVPLWHHIFGMVCMTLITLLKIVPIAQQVHIILNTIWLLRANSSRRETNAFLLESFRLCQTQIVFQIPRADLFEVLLPCYIQSRQMLLWSIGRSLLTFLYYVPMPLLTFDVHFFERTVTRLFLFHW
jgi:hypothetical protein